MPTVIEGIFKLCEIYVTGGIYKVKPRVKQPHTWEEEIIAVLKELGGEAHYSDIYQRIQDRGVMNLSSSWKNAVRGCMERFSSDSIVFEGKYGGNRDVFYSVDGLGEGIWGLRDFEEDREGGNITEDDLGFPEGKKKLRVHVSRERNPRVIRDAKARFKATHGRLFCEICGFDFVDKYGELGEDFIEGHHIIPVSEMIEGQRTRVEDIALICSNCHRMVHRSKTWLTREQFNIILNR
jgi:putative restriction endonuclease